jgi:hypothetical protein
VSPPEKLYRAYFFDAKQRVLTADWVECDTDEEAIAKARQSGFASKCEIWDGDRMVAQLEAERRQA